MASANVIELTTENWETEVAKSEVPVLVDFWAPWCGPCRALAPTIARIADQFAGRVKVGKLNTDSDRNTAIAYGIQSIPTVLVFKGGKVVQQLVGPNEKMLVAAIEDALK